MIVQHKGKLTIKQIEELSSEADTLLNLFYKMAPNSISFYLWLQGKESRFPLINKVNGLFNIHDEFEFNHRMAGGEVAMRLGTPNCNMKGYESYPGAWVFEDTEYNIKWLVFSDGIRKGCFKGTSYEIVMNNNLYPEAFRLAVVKFFKHIDVIQTAA